VEDVEAIADTKKHNAITRVDVESLMKRFSICLFYFVFGVENYCNFSQYVVSERNDPLSLPRMQPIYSKF